MQPQQFISHLPNDECTRFAPHAACHLAVTALLWSLSRHVIGNFLWLLTGSLVLGGGAFRGVGACSEGPNPENPKPRCSVPLR